MDLHLHDFYLVLLSVLIGLIIGAEREYRNKAAGLRTLMLVAVGSCIFTMLSIKIGIANPDRLAANIITGIGFLGAGAIFRDDNTVRGLTTACTIWITAALGMCVGSDHLFLATVGSVVVLFVLFALVYVQDFIDRQNRSHAYKITTVGKVDAFAEYEQVFKLFRLRFTRDVVLKNGDVISGKWHVTGPVARHDELVAYLLKDETIRELEF